MSRQAPSSTLIHERLIIFSRYPETGKVKTRLIPEVGAEKAAALQREMTERVCHTAKIFSGKRRVGLEVCFTGASHEQMRQWLGEYFVFAEQVPGDLGQRMGAAFSRAFQDGCGRMVMVGTDCPGISEEIFSQAFKELQRADVVLGPAEDGGYYLIGLTVEAPELFFGVRWGRDTVLEETLKRAKLAGRSVAMLPCLVDVDRPADLKVWEDFLAKER